MNGEGKPVSSRMLSVQKEVDDLRDTPVPGIRPEDIEILISSVLGAVLGILAVGVILYFTLNFSFVNSIYDPYKGSTTTFWNWWVERFTQWFCLPFGIATTT